MPGPKALLLTGALFVATFTAAILSQGNARADDVPGPDKATSPDKSTQPKFATEAELTARIDAGIEAVWKRDGVTPAPRTTDEEFLRRVFIDTIGMPPSVAETRAFLSDTAENKRAALIDRLIDDPRFGEHLADQWLTILSGRNKSQDGADMVLGVWLAAQFNANRGFDQVAADMIGAEGKMSDNPPAAYYAGKRELLTPDIAGEATKHFTGVQIQCAQCHDHPYEESWKMADFAGVASFFWPVQVQRKGDIRPRQGVVMDRKGERANFKELEKKLANVSAEQRMKILESRRFQAPKFLGGDEVSVNDARLWRKAWAKWVIDPANAQTRRYLANRFWSFVFGSGLHNPVDDFNSFNEPSHPELLDALGKDFAESGFDVKRLYRAMLKTRAWQLSSRGATRAEGQAELWHFAAYPVRQLSPEQFFAAMIVVRDHTEAKRGMRVGQNPYTKEREQAAKFEKRKEAGKLEPKEAKVEYDYEALDKLEALFEQVSPHWYLRRTASRAYTRLTQDDEMQEADTFTLSIDQALLVMNGEAVNMLSGRGKGTLIDGIMARSKEDSARLTELYLTVLNRAPTKEETTRATSYIKEATDPRLAWEDLAFALLAGSEFATNH